MVVKGLFIVCLNQRKKSKPLCLFCYLLDVILLANNLRDPNNHIYNSQVIDYIFIHNLFSALLYNFVKKKSGHPYL